MKRRSVVMEIPQLAVIILALQVFQQTSSFSNSQPTKNHVSSTVSPNLRLDSALPGAVPRLRGAVHGPVGGPGRPAGSTAGAPLPGWAPDALLPPVPGNRQRAVLGPGGSGFGPGLRAVWRGTERDAVPGRRGTVLPVDVGGGDGGGWGRDKTGEVWETVPDAPVLCQGLQGAVWGVVRSGQIKKQKLDRIVSKWEQLIANSLAHSTAEDDDFEGRRHSSIR